MSEREWHKQMNRRENGRKYGETSKPTGGRTNR